MLGEPPVLVIVIFSLTADNLSASPYHIWHPAVVVDCAELRHKVEDSLGLSCATQQRVSRQDSGALEDDLCQQSGSHGCQAICHQSKRSCNTLQTLFKSRKKIIKRARRYLCLTHEGKKPLCWYSTEDSPSSGWGSRSRQTSMPAPHFQAKCCWWHCWGRSPLPTARSFSEVSSAWGSAQVCAHLRHRVSFGSWKEGSWFLFAYS